MPPADEEGALGVRETEALFASFRDARGLALAVSGGADSLALMAVTHRWAQDHTIPVEVLTVDHRLQPDSQAIARDVVAAAERLGLPARILTWESERPTSGVEAAARTARYRLLLDAARTSGASHLLLAHHRNDIAEGLLMRLARGAGVFGLAAMRPTHDLGDLVLARPFLHLSRERLTATALAAGLVPVDDPMNDDPAFTRVRVRKMLPLLAAEGLDEADLAEAAHRLASAADAIDHAAGKLFADHCRVDEAAIVHVDRERLVAQPNAVRLRALERLLLAVGGGEQAPRHRSLQRLCAEHLDSDARAKSSLGGAVIESWPDGMACYRELGRDGLGATPADDLEGASIVWDRRFRVRIDGSDRAGTTIAALGENGRRVTGQGSVFPAALAATPALWRGEDLLSAPMAGFAEIGAPALVCEQIVAERLMKPPLFPDFATE